MRFLIDNALSPRVADLLKEEAFDARHVNEYGMGNSKDTEVLQVAEAEDRILVSADTDFGLLLKLKSSSRPSFILIRKRNALIPSEIVKDILFVIKKCEKDLKKGAIVVIEEDKIRIKELPISF